MLDITVAVDATAGSPFTPEDDAAGSYDLLWHGPSQLYGCPVGDGYMPDSLTELGGPANVLLLMEEPAHPDRSVWARPVALLHAVRDGQPYDEVLCVPAGDPRFAALTGPEALRLWHADEGALATVLRRFRPGHTWQITGCEGCREAEEFLAEAHHSYERLTGSLE
ncbi:inorganic diphosphatase [Streptomyces sp. NPDC047028]|uniref:inorganic diphosphatase n=1 Tax=Streptomyces sp. NPDC047028 TaxID=3155793 RepID=UPI0033C6707F